MLGLRGGRGSANVMAQSRVKFFRLVYLYIVSEFSERRMHHDDDMLSQEP